MDHTDKTGRAFEIRPYRSDDFSLLVEMYDDFTPKAKFQGMPPLKKQVRDDWIRQLASRGINLLAWHGGKVIGHGVLLHDLEKKDAEYLIFVSQDHRGIGVGKALICTAIDTAKEMCLETVWLTVDAYNFRAARLYKKAGFQCQNSYGAAAERMMLLSLPNHR